MRETETDRDGGGGERQRDRERERERETETETETERERDRDRDTERGGDRQTEGDSYSMNLLERIRPIPGPIEWCVQNAIRMISLPKQERIDQRRDQQKK